MFRRILCAVDETPESLVVIGQAGALLAPGGHLLLISIADTGSAAQAGFAATRAAVQLEEAAANAVEAAACRLPVGIEAAKRVLRGRRSETLKAVIEEERADLLCVGTHDRRRTSGIALGSVTTTMLHDAPCSVMVARPASLGRPFPESLAVGIDGSAESADALSCGREIAETSGARLSVVAALGGKGVDDSRITELDPSADRTGGKPVSELVTRSRGHDLLVVGNRGLHGLRALGSVSERVAHQARCSVLVVRRLPK